MDLPVTNSEVQDLTTPFNHTEQDDETMQEEVTMPVTQNTTLASGSDWEFLDAPDSADVRYNIKVSTKTAIVTPTIRPDSDPESDPELHFLQVLSNNIEVTGHERRMLE